MIVKRGLIPSAVLSDEFNDAAFGAEPGRWPLPIAHTPHQLWQRAVAAAGQGVPCTILFDIACGFLPLPMSMIAVFVAIYLGARFAVIAAITNISNCGSLRLFKRHNGAAIIICEDRK